MSKKTDRTQTITHIEEQLVADTTQQTMANMTEVPQKGASAIVPLAKRKKRHEVLNVSRQLMMEVRGDLMAVKALAMAIMVKNRTRQSRVVACNPYRLQKLTGLHSKTVRRYLSKLDDLNLIRWEGKDLVLLSLSERCNMKLPDTFDRSMAELENMLLAMYIIDIVKQKEYAKQTISSAYAPKREKHATERMKKARRVCKTYNYGNVYREYGLSYDTIAKRLGISLQKAAEVIHFAEDNHMLIRQKRQEQFYLHNARGGEKYMNLGKGVFCTKDNVYKIYANVYVLPQPLTA